MGKRFEAKGTKTGKYIEQGFFAGGDKTVSQASLKEIRRGPQKEYERIVIQLDAEKGVPYFQFQLAPDENRFVLSIWSDVDSAVDTAKLEKMFSSSKRVKKLSVLPRVEEGLTLLEFTLASGATKPKAEAFYLTNPSRIVVDIQ